MFLSAGPPNPVTDERSRVTEKLVTSNVYVGGLSAKSSSEDGLYDVWKEKPIVSLLLQVFKTSLDLYLILYIL